MKRIFIRLFCILTLLISTQAYAICSMEQVKENDRIWAEALNTRHAENMAKLYAHQAILVPTATSAPVVSQPNVNHYFSEMLAKFQSLHIDYDTNAIQLLSTSAISSGNYTIKGTLHDSTVASISGRYMFVYDSKPDSCMLINQKFSDMPA